MKILEITGEPILHGGQENFIYNILESINNPEFSIDVLTPYYCDNDKFKKLIKEKNGEVFQLNLDFRPWKSRRILYKPVLGFLRERQYDVIHIHTGSISVLAYESLAAHKTGIKKIIVHSHSTGENNLKHSIIQNTFAPIIKLCATDYLACNKEAAEMKFPKSSWKKTEIIKNGIKLDKFSRNTVIGMRLRENYGIPKDAYVIGHVGRFTIEKKHSFLVEVIEQLIKKDNSAYLLLIGEGELSKEIKKLVDEKVLQSKVIFTGVVDNPQDYYNMMDFFVLPSKYEGFPFVTLEAQANGLPCLVSTGVPEAVVLTESVKRLDLDVNLWVDYLVQHKEDGVCDNTSVLKMQGYDIKQSAEMIERIYLR